MTQGSDFLSVFTSMTQTALQICVITREKKKKNQEKMSVINLQNVFTFRNTDSKLDLVQWFLGRRESKMFLLYAVMKNFKLQVQGPL